MWNLLTRLLMEDANSRRTYLSLSFLACGHQELNSGKVRIRSTFWATCYVWRNANSFLWWRFAVDVEGALASTMATTAKNVTFKVNFRFLKYFSRLFQFTENVKCQRITLELISRGLHSCLERESKIRRSLFKSSIKREIRHFHVVVVQWRQINVQKGVMRVQSCCFANLNLLLFWRSRCRRRC